MTSNIWQIYYNDTTRRNCVRGWNHYNNAGKLTEYFENSVIVDLYGLGECKKADYFGVLSHSFTSKHFNRNKRNERITPINLDNELEQSRADVYGFHGRRKTKNVMTQAENFHRGGFKEITTEILDACGYRYPVRTDFVCLFNHWVARGEVYEHYIENLLIPAINQMREMKDRLFVDQKYKTRITPDMKKAGLDFYPLHPFILERLPSVYVQQHIRDLNFKQIF